MIVDVVDLNLEKLDFDFNVTKQRRIRGQRLFDYGYVKIKQVNKLPNGEITVSSIVNGNYYDYNVKLYIRNEKVYSCSCECMDNANGNVCKHIIATAYETVSPTQPSTKEKFNEMLEKKRKEREEQLLEQKRQIEYRKKYSTALEIIGQSQYYNDWKRKEEDNSTLDVRKLYNQINEENIYNSNSNSGLASNIEIEPQMDLRTGTEGAKVLFKIGEKTKYIIKDLEEFYKLYGTKEVLSYGKNLRFIADRANFTQESQKLLDFILKYGEMISFANDDIDYYYRMNTKIFTIKDQSLDQFMQVCKGKTIKVQTYKEKKDYQISNDKLDVNIQVKEKQDEYELKTNLGEYEVLFSNEKSYIFLNGNIYVLENKDENFAKLLMWFSGEKSILFPKDKKEEYEKFILPVIQKYTQYNEDENNNVALVNEMFPKMYLDVSDDGNITMETKFCYGENEVNILDKDYTEKLKEQKIQRDIPKERKILEKIFYDGFEILGNRKSFIMRNEDAMYEFLSQKIQDYMNSFEIMVTDKFKNKQIRKPKLSSVSVKLNNGLLELDISKLDFDLDEIKNVLKNYKIKKKYYKLKSGDFLDLEASQDLDLLSDVSSSFDVNYEKASQGVIKLPVNRSLYLEKILEKNDTIAKNKNEEFNDLVSDIENKNFSDKIKVSKKFDDILRDYQKIGYKWIKVLEHYGFGGILADDMGLGKTLQIIAVLESSLKENKTSIVVSPSSLVLNWKAEIEKWCPKIKVGIIKGTAGERRELIDNYSNYDLIVTSYDLLKRDVSEYEGKFFKYIIADEAQYIKNFTTQNATALKSLEGETKFALTGTPIENSLSELWSIFDFIMPGYLYTYNKFKKKIEEPVLKYEDKEALSRLKTMISPFVLRRIKKDVLTELPEKNITVMKNEMTKEQEKLYVTYFAQTQKEVREELKENGFEKSKFKILMLLTRLRQICCHPSLFIENYKGDSGKFNQCMDIITDAIEAEHKILLFSSYTSMFDLMEQELNRRGIRYYKLTGQTPVGKRVNMVEDFNKNDKVKIFLISLKAGGTGLNLTGADVVIHYDPWWNVSIENQATDRAYRIGQKNSVQVYKLITENSIEEKINKLQHKKAKLSEQLLTTDETFINKLSKDEIMDLFQ